MTEPAQLRFDERGLIPAVVQDVLVELGDTLAAKVLEAGQVPGWFSDEARAISTSHWAELDPSHAEMLSEELAQRLQPVADEEPQL